VDSDNYKEELIDTDYYTEEELGILERSAHPARKDASFPESSREERIIPSIRSFRFSYKRIGSLLHKKEKGERTWQIIF